MVAKDFDWTEAFEQAIDAEQKPTGKMARLGPGGVYDAAVSDQVQAICDAWSFYTLRMVRRVLEQLERERAG